MQLRTALLGLLACAALVAVNTAARADIINEVEPNNTFATAQIIPDSAFTLNFDPNIGLNAGAAFVNTSTTIPHATVLLNIGGTTPDFFRFTHLGGQIILDIDSSPVVTNHDAFISLFNSAGQELAFSDDNGGDPGDIPGVIIGGAFNSRIQSIQPAGDFVVSVQGFGGAPQQTATLNISAFAPQQIPEPTTLALLGMGAFAAAGYVVRKRRRAS